MRASELPINLFGADGARLLHLTGITPALSPNLAATARWAFTLAKKVGWKFSFDLNYRGQLWTPAAALEGCTPFIQAADFLLAPFDDVRLLYDLEPRTTSEQALNLLREHAPQATIVLTLGEDGAVGVEPQGQIMRQPVYPAEQVGRLGSGDAFAAGFLYGYLTTAEQQQRLAQALRWGAAMAAFKYSIPGDIPVIDRVEIEKLIRQNSVGSGLVR